VRSEQKSFNFEQYNIVTVEIQLSLYDHIWGNMNE